MAEDLIPLPPTAVENQAARIAALPGVYRTPYERLACELAIGLDDPETVFQSYGLTPEQGSIVLDSPEFLPILARISKEVRESGVSFKAKVKMAAEELLADAFDIAHNPLEPTSERVKMIMWHGKMAGHEPKEDKVDGRVGGGLNLSITFAGQAPQAILKHEPLTLENQESCP